MSDWKKIVKEAQKGKIKIAKKLWLGCKAFKHIDRNNYQNWQLMKKIISNYSGWDLAHAPHHK